MPSLMLGMPVDAADETTPLGRLIAIACDPDASRVAHIIVASDDEPKTGHLVRSGLILHADTRLALNITRHGFAHMPKVDASVVDADASNTAVPAAAPGGAHHRRHRFAFALHGHLEPSELVMDRSTTVMDADGHTVGTLGGTLYGSPDQQLTHLVVTLAHADTPRDVAAPIAAVAAVDRHGVRLGRSVGALDQLPPLPSLGS